MRRVRFLEGLLQDDEQQQQLQQQQQQPQTVATAEMPPYTRDPTRNSRQSGSDISISSNRFESPPMTAATAKGGITEFSPWDEDQLWWDKLRRASIRHTRSMEIVLADESAIHQQPTHGQRSRNKQQPQQLPVIPASEDTAGDDGDDCYERLIQYSATLERTKRGQSYLDGYMWDEIEQRFRQPNEVSPPSSAVVMTSPQKTAKKTTTTTTTPNIVSSSASPF